VIFGRRRIERRGSGSFVIRLSAEEREVLGRLPGQLRELLDDPDPDEAVLRLFPAAYGDDVVRNAGWEMEMRDELLARRKEALDVMEATVAAERLDTEQLTAWMRSINDLRLVIGTRLGIEEDHDLGAVPETHPAYPAVAYYTYLSVLLEDTVEALAGDL
jgi:hypothetical protein